MTSHVGPADRERRIDELLDRQEILDCITRCARGMDRHDASLMASAYHPDAVDEHGTFRGTASAFILHVNGDGRGALGAHELQFRNHHHYVTNTTLEVQGTTAHAESYYLFCGEVVDGTGSSLVFGRYIDLFERRDGQWRIAKRRVVLDAAGTLDGRDTVSEWARSQFIRGTWDREDISYQRIGGTAP